MNTEYSVNFIRKFLKIQLNMSYGRVESSANNANLQKIHMIKNNMQWSYQNQFKNVIFVYLDESSINSNVKTLYSWSFKGVPTEKKNSPFSDQSAEFWKFYQMVSGLVSWRAKQMILIILGSLLKF